MMNSNQRSRFSGILKEQRKGETKKQLEEIHSERSWKKLSELRCLAVDQDRREKLGDDLCS
jgi:hypothetical protein